MSCLFVYGMSMKATVLKSLVDHLSWSTIF